MRWDRQKLWRFMLEIVTLTTECALCQQLQTVTICDTLASVTRCLAVFARTHERWIDVMRLSWSQHLAAARTLELAGREETGTALALMGMALVMLLQDLQSMTACESSATDQPWARLFW
jgi:hypothetical protein